MKTAKIIALGVLLVVLLVGALVAYGEWAYQRDMARMVEFMQGMN